MCSSHFKIKRGRTKKEVATAAARRASQIEALAQLTKERRAKRTAHSAQTAKRVGEAVEAARGVLQTSAAELAAKHRSEVAAMKPLLILANLASFRKFL